MKYNVEFENEYVKSFVKDDSGEFEFDATKLKLEYLNCYKASGATLILDEEKYNALVDTKAKEDEIARLKKELADTDYQAIKYSEGWISEEDYAPIKANREALREQIRALESDII